MSMDTAGLYQIFSMYPRIVTDSRQVMPDSLFFALRGEKFNGNEFAAAALEKGARYAVVDDPAVAKNESFILVEDSLKALQDMAAFHRQSLNIPLIAITGSNGKTTTKEILTDILSTQYEVYATKGNLNNHIGVPLTLLAMSDGIDIGIVEMGANHPGEIAMLCGLAEPDYGLITNIGSAHLEGFGDIEGVKKAKGELYGYLGEKGGFIFCNAGDPVLREMLAGNETGISYYGRGRDSVCSGEVVSSDPYLSIRLDTGGAAEIEVSTRLAGSYNLENILAAVAVGLHFRIRPENIKLALAGWSADNNRSQRIETGRNILIMDAYNANPSSMAAALENFKEQEHPDKVLVLGDMLELGGDTVNHHRKILDLASGLNCREIFLVGTVFSSLELPGNTRAFPSVEELDAHLAGHLLSGRLILLKASRGLGLERIKDRL
jgi:UDP-N-acetylmuramoyl-tripeptide--D-alanyl-D-alanine ligase